MAYSPTDLKREIRDLVSSDLIAAKDVNRGWLVSAVLSRHPLGKIKDKDFNVLCRQSAVIDAVRDVLRDLKFGLQNPSGSSRQLRLPGFKHLQRGYPVEDEAGDVVIRATANMSDAELFEKADAFDAMGDGCHEHADELRRFARERGKAVA